MWGERNPRPMRCQLNQSSWLCALGPMKWIQAVPTCVVQGKTFKVKSARIASLVSFATAVEGAWRNNRIHSQSISFKTRSPLDPIDSISCQTWTATPRRLKSKCHHGQASLLYYTRWFVGAPPEYAMHVGARPALLMIHTRLAFNICIRSSRNAQTATAKANCHIERRRVLLPTGGANKKTVRCTIIV